MRNVASVCPGVRLLGGGTCGICSAERWDAGRRGASNIRLTTHCVLVENSVGNMARRAANITQV